MNTAVVQGLKEMARNAILAIVPVLLAGINVQTGDIHFDLRVLVATVLVTVITGVDRWLHVKGRIEERDGESHGLVKL